jgi:hypothetical protein
MLGSSTQTTALPRQTGKLASTLRQAYQLTIAPILAAARWSPKGRWHRLLRANDLCGENLVNADDGEEHQQREDAHQVRRPHPCCTSRPAQPALHWPALP